MLEWLRGEIAEKRPRFLPRALRIRDWATVDGASGTTGSGPSNAGRAGRGGARARPGGGNRRCRYEAIDATSGPRLSECCLGSRNPIAVARCWRPSLSRQGVGLLNNCSFSVAMPKRPRRARSSRSPKGASIRDPRCIVLLPWPAPLSAHQRSALRPLRRPDTGHIALTSFGGQSRRPSPPSEQPESQSPQLN